MNYFEGLAFYLVMILILIPAMILGMMEKKQGWYQLASSVVILVLVFANRREEFLFLTLFLAWSISLIWLYLHLRRTRGRKERLFHLILILALLPLAACKISPLFSGSLFAFTGISYLTFRVLQILIEIYDGVIGSLSLPETPAFFLFFPSFSSGPIDRSRRFGEDYHRQRSREEYLSLCGDGILHLLVGAVYKFVLAAFFFKAMGYLDSEEASWYLWIGYAYAYSGYLFFDFAGYSRMAKGCGCILGTSLPDNFRAPFISKDIRILGSLAHQPVSLVPGFCLYPLCHVQHKPEMVQRPPAACLCRLSSQYDDYGHVAWTHPFLCAIWHLSRLSAGPDRDLAEKISFP